MIGYSRYAPHCRAFRRLASELTFFSDPALALAQAGEVRARRAAGELFVLWEVAPPEVTDAWGAPDLVLSNGFFPHYATVSWDRRGWVASAAWPKAALEGLEELERVELELWIEDYRHGLRGEHPVTAAELGLERPYLLVVLQTEDDLVARWWPDGCGSEWLVRRAAEHGAKAGLEVIVKQHPYDPRQPDDYDVDRSRIQFLPKNAVAFRDLGRVNDALLAGASEVWGFNSTVLTEAALLHATPTRAFGPTLLDGHGILLEETPTLGAAEATPGLTPDQRRLSLLRRVLARQVDRKQLGRFAPSILADQELGQPAAHTRSGREAS